MVSEKRIVASCLVMEKIVAGYGVILGMDITMKPGGVIIDGTVKQVEFGVSAASAMVSGSKMIDVEDVDFSARSNGDYWTVKWKWTDREQPCLENKVSCYRVATDLKVKYVKEIETWIKEGILEPVEQPAKGKVRPVLDFRALNEFVSSHPGGSAVCDETIRNWRKSGQNITIVDLRKAYLQLRADPALWTHQVMQFRGKFYYLTRVGFGLNCAPKIMSTILQKVLSLDSTILSGTDHYIDDILVNESIVSVGTVVKHLQNYGPQTKAPERIDGARILGLQVDRNEVNGSLRWSRGNIIPKVGDRITRRELFSICGQLIGHYPVAGWIRVACGFVKRHSKGEQWEDEIGDRSHAMLLKKIVEKVIKIDPVGGRWEVSGAMGPIWCDASSLAIGCSLEIDDDIIEDAAWLQKKENGGHINMAELDAVILGVNLAAKWQMKQVEIMSDSATVIGCLNSVLYNTHKVRTKSMSEMLVKRRLSILKELFQEYSMVVSVRWVNSGSNKADHLTRVPPDIGWI